MNMSSLLSALSNETSSTNSFNEFFDHDIHEDNSNYIPAKDELVIPANDIRILNFVNPNVDTGPWIAGGTVLNWYNGEEATADIDVFCASRQQYDTLFRKATSYRNSSITHQSENAATITMNSFYGNQYKLQLICKQYYDSAEQVIDGFDITVCQILIARDENLVLKFAFGKNTINDIKNKRLRLAYDGDIKQVQIRRVIKYIAYGYVPDSSLLNKIQKSGGSIDWKFGTTSGFDEYENL